MYYSKDLLSLKKGRFGIVWLAATRGTKHLNKRDIVEINIRSSCMELLEYVSGAKTARFSLYLSAQLTFGLCTIYREKVSNALREAQDLYSRSLTTFRPQYIEIDDIRPVHRSNMLDMDIELPLHSNEGFGSFNLPGSLLQSQFDLSISEINNISFENSFSLQARIEDITLVEVGTTPKLDELTFGEDFRTEFSLDLFGEKCTKADLSEIPEKVLLNDELSTTEKPASFSDERDKSKRVTFIAELEQDETQFRSKKHTSSQLELLQEMSNETLHKSQQSEETKNGEITSIMVDYTIEPIIEINLPETVHTADEKMPEATCPRIDTVTDVEGTKETVAEFLPTVPLRPEPIELGFPIPAVEMPLPCAESTAQKSRTLRNRTLPNDCVPPVRLEELRESQLPLPRVGHKRKNVSFPIVDNPRKLSKEQLRSNLESANFNLYLRSEVLAPPSSSTHPRRMLSLNVARLLALPANWETAISSTLGELWKSKRRICEAHDYSNFEAPAQASSSGINSLQRSSSRDNKSNSLRAICESDFEASREEARAARDSSISMLPRPASGQLEVTIKEVMNNTGETSLNLPTSSQLPLSIPEEGILPPDLPRLVVLPLQEKELPLGSLQSESIHQPPQDELVPSAQEHESIPIDAISSVPEVLLTDLRPLAFPSENSLGCFLDEAFAKGACEVDFAKVIAPRATTSRKSAAKTLHHLLCLLKHRRITVMQEEPFQPILVRPLS